MVETVVNRRHPISVQQREKVLEEGSKVVEGAELMQSIMISSNRPIMRKPVIDGAVLRHI